MPRTLSTALPLIMICAASAGVHAVLAPTHFHEGAVPGVGFAVAAVALAAVVFALDRRPHSRRVRHTAALLLGTLIVAYVATRIASVPLLGDHREPMDAVGVVTKLIEAAGLALAIGSVNEGVARRKPLLATEKGVIS